MSFAAHPGVTPDTVPEIFRLRALGLSFVQVAAALGLPKTVICNRYYRALQRRRKGDTAARRLRERRAAEIDLYNQGVSLAEIGRRLGVSDQTVLRDVALARAAGRDVVARPRGPRTNAAPVARLHGETPRQAEEFARAMGGCVYDYGPFVERPFVRVDRPGLVPRSGTTASQCAEQGASGGWAWRATSKTYGKAGAP